MFIQIAVPNGNFSTEIPVQRPQLSVHSSPSRAGISLFT
jgi:hypothetical protein